MDRFNEMVDLVQTFEKDFNKYYTKGNRTAGIRLRKHMQSLRQFAKVIRDEVQATNSERNDVKKAKKAK